VLYRHTYKYGLLETVMCCGLGGEASTALSSCGLPSVMWCALKQHVPSQEPAAGSRAGPVKMPAMRVGGANMSQGKVNSSTQIPCL